jgi:hypothetical protein
MSATTTALADTLPSSIPKLDPAGTNWTVFLFRFQDAIDAKGFWDHFDGSSPMPTMSILPKEEELAVKTQWEKDEWSSKSLLFSEITRFDDGIDTLEAHSKREVGGGGEGVHFEKQVCEDWVEGKVFGNEV